MNVTYFRDTDTAPLESSEQPVRETKEINENVYLDLDAGGNVVSMTIEHAGASTTLPQVLVQQYGGDATR